MIKTIEKFCYEKRLRFGYGTDAGMEDFFGVTPNGVFVILDRPRVGLTEGEVVLRGNAVQYRDELAAMLGRNGNEVTKVSDNRLHVVFRNVRIMSCGYNDIPNFPKYLCFKAGSGGGTVSMVSDLATKPNLQYSVDQIVWYDLVVDSAGGDSDVLDLAANEKVYLRGTNSAFSDGTNISKFVMTGTISASGNLNSILFGTDDSQSTLSASAYKSLFSQCASLVSVSSDLLPSTSLGNNCYYGLFSDCTGLTEIPEGFLPATTLSRGCYYYMFSGCTNLVTVPFDLLPATTLTISCYAFMFSQCKKITVAPFLPAPNLEIESYTYLFNGCSALNSITCLATDISASLCTQYWVLNVPAGGTFYKDSTMTNWTTGSSGIPSGWTVEDYTE